MFDMNKCKKGDKLVLRNDTIVTYMEKRKDNEIYPHFVVYPDGSLGNRTNEGRIYHYKEKGESDVVGFYEQSEPKQPQTITINIHGNSKVVINQVKEDEDDGFDMSQCKVGDKLILGNGDVVTYIGDYKIKYENGIISTRTSTGKCYDSEISHERDVVGFHKPTFDMTKCKFGDNLLCRNGTKVVFVCKDKFTNRHPFIVITSDGRFLPFTNLGKFWKDEERDMDIIGFCKEEKN